MFGCSLINDIFPGFTYLLSTNGKTIILLNDYTFTYHRKFSRSQHWRCSKHVSKGCKARIILDKNTSPGNIKVEHNHKPCVNYFIRNGYFVSY